MSGFDAIKTLYQLKVLITIRREIILQETETKSLNSPSELCDCPRVLRFQQKTILCELNKGFNFYCDENEKRFYARLVGLWRFCAVTDGDDEDELFVFFEFKSSVKYGQTMCLLIDPFVQPTITMFQLNCVLGGTKTSKKGEKYLCSQFVWAFHLLDARLNAAHVASSRARTRQGVFN
jgi:hypothetical protein